MIFPAWTKNNWFISYFSDPIISIRNAAPSRCTDRITAWYGLEH